MNFKQRTSPSHGVTVKLQTDYEEDMKLYALSLGTGLLVGVVYSLLQVRSPAPPLIALFGLLGMLAGEQIIPMGKQLLISKLFAEEKVQTAKQDDAMSIRNKPEHVTVKSGLSQKTTDEHS
jgi:XapX domain-containing protein